MNILVIDDEPIIHEGLKKVLGREGFHVVSVMSAREGLDHLTRADYDLIITDLMMPEMDGLDFLQELRKASYTIPTIMLTGYPTIRTALQALRLGATDYIPKPFTRKELLPPIHRALRKRPQDDPLSHHTTTRQRPYKSIKEDPVRPPLPGDKFHLPEHSWAIYTQNGIMNIGIEGSFLQSVSKVVRLNVPLEDELVEQGFPGITLVTSDGEEHTIFLPISGRIVQRNTRILTNPSSIDPDTWIVQVIPSQLIEEISYLQKD